MRKHILCLALIMTSLLVQGQSLLFGSPKEIEADFGVRFKKITLTGYKIIKTTHGKCLYPTHIRIIE